MSTKDGGPAFPAPNWYDNSPCGMTLRDYFAAKALSTVAAYSQEDLATWAPTDFAEHAYLIADAMIAARETK